MEEAIASSQMEGANTTRKVAKEMLRKQIKPKDKSQQMIYNNYNTIRFLSEQKGTNLTPELLLEIHKRITEKTLDNPDDEGSFRKDDNIYVVNGITGEVAHDPPSYKAIPVIINKLCHIRILYFTKHYRAKTMPKPPFLPKRQDGMHEKT